MFPFKTHILPPSPLSQALLANIASLYAVYHGPEGLKTIAARCNGLAAVLAAGAKKLGHAVPSKPFFDTVAVTVPDASKVGGDGVRGRRARRGRGASGG